MTVDDMTAPDRASRGPLAGVRVLELGGIGPGPFAAMLLADLGADVVRIDRPGARGIFPGSAEQNLLNRGKRSIQLNLKDSDDLGMARQLVARADVVIEGFRPGASERMGLGPGDCLALAPHVVYGRMTGWGQDGPIARTAGHDLNYIARTGVLHAIGPASGPPQIPLNMIGDFGGGGMYLVVGILAALHEVDRGQPGQVIDAAIVDGVSHLLAGTHARLASGTWVDRRESNVLDGAAPYYRVYETSDGRYLAVGAIEPQFYREFLAGLGLAIDPETQDDRDTWPAVIDAISARIRSDSLDHWLGVFDGTDACVAPVRSLREAAHDTHLAERGSLIEVDGVLQPGSAPRFSRHQANGFTRPPRPGEHTHAVIADWIAPKNDQ